jgi:hypothetical protein
MTNDLTRTLAAVVLAFTSTLSFGEAPEHFEGEASPTLEAALANLATYNAKLEALLAKEKLSLLDMNQVHELTYTLENALARIDAHVEATAEALESVHKASERADAEVVKADGRRYLDDSQRLLP